MIKESRVQHEWNSDIQQILLHQIDPQESFAVTPWSLTFNLTFHIDNRWLSNFKLISIPRMGTTMCRFWSFPYWFCFQSSKQIRYYLSVHLNFNIFLHSNYRQFFRILAQVNYNERSCICFMAIMDFDWKPTFVVGHIISFHAQLLFCKEETTSIKYIGIILILNSLDDLMGIFSINFDFHSHLDNYLNDWLKENIIKLYVARIHFNSTIRPFLLSFIISSINIFSDDC